jgi:hypothetical protein
MVNELSSKEISFELFGILLIDRTTGKNIVWGTTDYDECVCQAEQEIQVDEIGLIRPRYEKIREWQKMRTRDRAEIFTPSWLCNEQNNLVDEAWFGKKEVFNVVTDNRKHTWQATLGKIFFNEERVWQFYVEANRLEVACGEAPYLVSRYDAVTGEPIEISQRVGLLDRKFRILFENATSNDERLTWIKCAVQSVYGYDFQGDNLFLARKNILLSVVEYFTQNFSTEPSEDFLLEIAEIISWNLWQMDGLTNTIPYANIDCQGSLEGFGKSVNLDEKIYCKIKSWSTGDELEYRDLLKGAHRKNCLKKVSSTS